MEEMRHYDTEKEMLVEKHYAVPPLAKPITVEVIELKEGVRLKGDGWEYDMTITGARDLAFELRRAANNVDRCLIGAGFKPAKKHHGKTKR